MANITSHYTQGAHLFHPFPEDRKQDKIAGGNFINKLHHAPVSELKQQTSELG